MKIPRCSSCGRPLESNEQEALELLHEYVVALDLERGGGTPIDSMTFRLLREQAKHLTEGCR